jgi:hypothetical protein
MQNMSLHAKVQERDAHMEAINRPSGRSTPLFAEPGLSRKTHLMHS